MTRKLKTTDTRITEIESEKAKLQSKIDNYKVILANFDSRIQELKDTQAKKEIEELYNTLKAAGKTPQDVMNALGLKK